MYSCQALFTLESRPTVLNLCSQGFTSSCHKLCERLNTCSQLLHVINNDSCKHGQTVNDSQTLHKLVWTAVTRLDKWRPGGSLSRWPGSQAGHSILNTFIHGLFWRLLIETDIYTGWVCFKGKVKNIWCRQIRVNRLDPCIWLVALTLLGHQPSPSSCFTGDVSLLHVCNFHKGHPFFIEIRRLDMHIQTDGERKM